VQQIIDRNMVGSSFHRQAAEYDRYASVQKRVVNNVISLVQSHIIGNPSQILDIGCGTGQLLASLHAAYPDTQPYGLDLAYNMLQCASERLQSSVQLINGDAERLPFKDAKFDLIVSTSTLQWLDTLDTFFLQACRVLTARGLLCVAFFGERTLCELRECFRIAVEESGSDNSTDYTSRLHRFKGRPDVERALEQTDFDRAVIISELETEYYSDVNDLLRSIKRIGAGASAQAAGRRGLGWKSILQKTARIYQERYGINGKIPATYEVIYVVAHAPTVRANPARK
jgi:malonyl-CoA O-methyltransferase